MANYEVEFEFLVTAYVEVEADSHDEALKVAYDGLDFGDLEHYDTRVSEVFRVG